MGISIKHDEIEGLIRQLARRRGSSLTDAIGDAVRAELARHPSPGLTTAEIDQRYERIRLIQAEVREHGIDYARSEADILGLDEDGIPEQPWLDAGRR